MVEIEVNANTTARFLTGVETATWNGNIYAPVPMLIGEEEQTADMSLPRMFVDVSNYGGQAFRFAKDNDLSLNDVTIRLVNLSLTSSGDDARIRLQITGAAFNNEAGRFDLGFAFSYDVDGPRRTWNRRDHTTIPFNFQRWGVISND